VPGTVGGSEIVARNLLREIARRATLRAAATQLGGRASPAGGDQGGGDGRDRGEDGGGDEGRPE